MGKSNTRGAKRRGDLPVTLTLSIPQRAFLLGLLPGAGSYVGMRARRELAELLSPDPDEAERAGYRDLGGGNAGWNALLADGVIRELAFSKDQVELLKKGLKDASDNERLPECLLDAWDALGIE